jgi:hypothetical protein
MRDSFNKSSFLNKNQKNKKIAIKQISVFEELGQNVPEKAINMFLPEGAVHFEVPYDTYYATLVNQSFDEEKYPQHSDILQVRYGKKSPLAQRLRGLFAVEYHWLQSEREKRGRSRVPLRLPEEMEKRLLLSCGSQKKLCLLTAQ